MCRGLLGALAPEWRIMLLRDGSVMRHLQLLTGLRRWCTPAPRMASFYGSLHCDRYVQLLTGFRVEAVQPVTTLP